MVSLTGHTYCKLDAILIIDNKKRDHFLPTDLLISGRGLYSWN